MNPSLPNRQSIRKRGWNYAEAGWYFVTINTHGSRALFGAVVNGRMVLNEAGRMVQSVWDNLPLHYPGIAVDAAVVMPNHFHGIVRLAGRDRSPGEGQDRSPEEGRDRSPARTDAGAGLRASPLSLPDIVRNFKSYTTSQYFKHFCPNGHAPDKLWHRNYWDVIVRDARALAAIRNYIRDNPAHYARVMHAGEPRLVGNAELLRLPKVGFLASRGDATPHGDLPMKPGEAILSGFLSPMERAVFKAGLEHRRPMIWVVPLGIDGQLPAPAARALDEGRLLMISPFPDSIESPSLRRAAWCNEYVLVHCDRLVVGHLNPSGMLACILSEANPEMGIIHL